MWSLDMKRIILIAFFTLLAVGLPLTAQMIYKSDKNLSDNGIEIEATIISAEGKGMSQDVKVEYINDKGEKVTAKGVVSDGVYDVGREFKGRYFPDEPDKVIQPPKRSLKWTVYGVIIVLTFISLFAECRLLRSLFLRNSVGAHGVTARAQVVNFNPNTKQCTINFTRADGVDCTVTMHSDVAYASGGYINIRYIPKGKSARVIILGY